MLFRSNASLSEIDVSFQNIHVAAISKAEVQLNNGMVLHKSDSLYPGIFGETFQMTMLNLAIDRHFEKEYDNFCADVKKIKTLSLFFIDSIQSFRDDGFLRQEFERLLKEKLNALIEKYQKSARREEKEYADYLLFSLANLKKTIAGYFAEVNNTDNSLDRKSVV